MSDMEKQLNVLKRRLKEWEAAFLKTNGRKATIQDIAQVPSIEAEYKKYRAEKKRLAGGSQRHTGARQKSDTIGSKRTLTSVEENEIDSVNKQTNTVSSYSEGPNRPSSGGRRISYQFESPRIKRRSESTPSRQRSKVEAFVSSVKQNSPSRTGQSNKTEERDSEKLKLQGLMSPANRRQTNGVSPGERAKRLLRTPTKLSSKSHSSPIAFKSLESVFQEGESSGKHSLMELFTQSSEELPIRTSASPMSSTLTPGVDESVDFFLEGMADTPITSESPFSRPSQNNAPRRRDKRPGLGFAPSNSLDEIIRMSSNEMEPAGKPQTEPSVLSPSQPQSLSPLNFRIARPSFGSANTSTSPSAAKGEGLKNNIMPGFYSSLASTQSSRRLLISPERRQRLLRQLSDHGSIGNVILEGSSQGYEPSQESALDEDDDPPQEVWKKKPIQKRQTRRYKIPFVDTSITRSSRRAVKPKDLASPKVTNVNNEDEEEAVEQGAPEKLSSPKRRSLRSRNDDQETVEPEPQSTSVVPKRRSTQSKPVDQDSVESAANKSSVRVTRRSTRKGKGLNTGPQVSNNFVALRLPTKGRSKFKRRR